MRTLYSLRLAWLAALVCLLIGMTARAQAPGWHMAAVIGTPVGSGSSSSVNATAVDSSGNVYLAGSFKGTVNFGTTTLISTGNKDVFAAKWNPVTGVEWVQQAGGTFDDEATALVLSDNNVYVTGHFASVTANFGLNTLTNSSPPAFDVFVAKLTTVGSNSFWTWVQRAGGTDFDYAYGLAASGNSLYVAGYFNSPIADFGPVILTGAGGGDAFVAKLTDAGSTSTWTWAQPVSGVDFDYMGTLALRDSSVYVAGGSSSATINFGSISLTNPSNAGDMFVAKLTDSGSTSAWTWALRSVGTGYESANAVAVSGTNVYVAGTFEGTTAAFGPTTLTSAGPGFADVFVAKVTDAGSTSAWAWAQRAGGPNIDQASALAVSGSSVYLTGYFRSAPATFGATTLTTAGNYDAYVAKLTDQGITSAWLWAQQAGGSDREFATELTLSGSTLYVGGAFQSPAISFGATTLTNNAGPTDPAGFLASLTDPLLATPAPLPRVGLTLAPNPAHHTAHLTGTVPHATLTLLDELGRAVLTTTADAAGEATFDMRGLTPGLYAVCSAGLRTQRLVVQ